MSLYTITYVSLAEHPMNTDEILEILDKAREKNARLNVSGMLLYRDQYFIQSLEGEESVVKELYDTISRDERHRNVLLVHQGPVRTRAFGDWSMGFNNIEGVDPAELKGYTDFLDREFDPEAIRNSGSRAVALLELFKERSAY